MGKVFTIFLFALVSKNSVAAEIAVETDNDNHF